MTENAIAKRLWMPLSAFTPRWGQSAGICYDTVLAYELDRRDCGRFGSSRSRWSTRMSASTPAFEPI